MSHATPEKHQLTAMSHRDLYDYNRPIEQQFPVGSLVAWGLDPNDELYWRSLKAKPGEVMLVLNADSEWRGAFTSSTGHFPACEVLQGDQRRWVAAMYLLRVL
jgi:hypothetical protein